MVCIALGIGREEVSTTGVEYRGTVRTVLGIAREEVSTTGVENEDGLLSVRHSYSEYC